MLRGRKEPYMILRILPIISVLLFGNACVFIQKITNPVTGIVAWRSCISIDVPPITLTPERTAAERQLVGEDRKLEDDGWMIASSQSSYKYERNAGAVGVGDEELKRYRRLYQERAVIQFYKELVTLYMSESVLGEGGDGYLKLVPENRGRRRDKFATQAELRKALNVAQEVNRSRKWIFTYFSILDGRKKKGSDPGSVRKAYLDVYRERAPRGVWIQNDENRWVKKR